MKKISNVINMEPTEKEKREEDLTESLQETLPVLIGCIAMTKHNVEVE